MTFSRQQIFKALTSIVLAVALFLGAVRGVEWLIPYVIDLQEIKQGVEEAVSTRVFAKEGWRMEIEDIWVKLTWTGPKAIFSNATLTTPQRKEALKIREMGATVRWWPLITGRTPELDKLEMEAITAVFLEDPEIEIVEEPDKPKEIETSDTSIILRDFTVETGDWIDQLNAFYVEGEKIEVRHYDSDRPLDVTFEGEVSAWDPGEPDFRREVDNLYLRTAINQAVFVAEKPSEKIPFTPSTISRLDFNVKELDLGQLAWIIRRYGSDLKARGILDSLSFDYRRPIEKRATQPLRERLRLLVESTHDIQIALEDYDFAFDPGYIKLNTELWNRQEIRKLDLVADADPYRVEAGGKIALDMPIQLDDLLMGKPINTEALKKGVSVDLDVKTTMLPMTFLDFIPETSPLGRLFAQASGAVRLDSKIRGALEDPGLQGEMEFEDLAFTHLRWDEDRQDLVTGGITDVYGTVRFRGKRVILDDLQGMLNGTPFQLDVDFDREEKTFSEGHFVSKRLDVNAFKLTLLHFADILELSVPGPAKQLAYEGTARANLRFKGSLEKPSIKGFLVLDDLALYALEEAQRRLLKNINGRIDFDGRTALIPGLAFQIDDQTMKVSGRYLIDRERLDLQILGRNLQAGPLVENLIRLARTLDAGVSREMVQALDRFLVTGIVNVALKVTGSVDNPAINGSVRLQQVDVALRQTGQALAENLRGSIHFNQQTATLQQVGFLFGRQPMVVIGAYGINTRRLETRLTSKSFEVKPVVEKLILLVDALNVEMSPELRQQLERFEVAGLADLDIGLKGLVDEPEIAGNLKLDQITLTDRRQNVTISGITGKLLLEPTRLVLENIRAFLGSSQFLVEGVVNEGPDGAYRDYRFHLTGEGVSLQKFREEVLANITDLQELAAQIRDLSGVANIDLIAAGVLEPKAQPKLAGEITVQDLSVFLEALGTEAQLEDIRLSFTEEGRLVLPRTRGRTGPIEFVVAGEATDLLAGEPVFEFTLDTAAIPMTSLMEDPAFFQNLIGFPFPIPSGASGVIDFTGLLSNEAIHGTLLFDDAMLAWDEGTEVRELDGQVRVSVNDGQINLSTQTLGFKTGDYLVENDFSIALEQTDNLDDPFHALVWLDSKLFNLQNLTENPLYRLCVNALMRNQTLGVKDSYLGLLDGGDIEVSGVVKNPLSMENLAYQLRFFTPTPLDLTAFGKNLPDPAQAGGQANIDVTLVSVQQSPQPEALQDAYDVADPLFTVTGEVNFEQAKLALLRIQELTGDFDLNGADGTFDISRFKIPGVEVGLSGEITSVSEFPVPLERVKIQGPLFATPAWDLYLKEVGEGLIMKHLVLPVFGPPPADAPAVPVTFRDASLNIDEVIYQNIIITDVTGGMDLLPSGFLQLRGVQADVAGGDIAADIASFPKNNGYVAANIKAQGVKANALAVALVNAPNQIFGDLDGTIQFTTQGQSEEEAIANANGAVSFSVTNGRLPAIAKVETLLVAANIIRGGVLGLNLNNIIRALQPFDTNYFAELSGNLRIMDGVAHTDDILSDGENLDLLIQGSLRMADGYADLVVNGTMSQNVTGALGELGKLSVASVLQFVPGLGYIPGSDRGGLLSYIPGVGYVPGFGGRVRDTSRFEVVIEGQLDNPNAIQGFEWTSGRSAQASSPP